jgi:hypothetical protein
MVKEDGMRNIALAGVLLLLLTGTAFGAPYLVSDPQEGVVGYEIKGLGNTVTYIAQADGSLKYDLAPKFRFNNAAGLCIPPKPAGIMLR